MSEATPATLSDRRHQIHLTGFMGSGKSTVGKLLARRLLWNFLDLDGVIERHEGRPVARIFAEDGEGAFRSSERHVLRQVVGKPRTVVALGGGTLIDEANRTICHQRAVVVWLRCPLEVLEARCAGEAALRPLWGEREALERRYAERLVGYKTAELIVDAAGPPEVVAEVVLQALVQRL
ncbi:MAG: shikimate kinase [Acidobacteriota bacterium]|jgi:shikimate kinase